MNDIQLSLVNFEQAKALKELGFPQNIEKYNHNWVNPKGMFGGPFEKDCLMCPTLELVAKWLREETDLILFPILLHHVDVCSKNQVWAFDIRNKGIMEETGPYNRYSSYEEALSAGIDKAIEILKT